ncbi:MAG: flagellar export chaperone FlgN [Candidatus Hydrogenedentes bacterium]|nr:flagellar export chaperone FlgN [Candidatus Hydrogenedentota bacterium]
MSVEALQALCKVLEDELERQENVLAVCLAQGEAARAHNVAALETKTAALTLLIEQAAKAERERLRLVHEIVDALKLPVEQQSLSGLIAHVEEPWRLRLSEVQHRLRTVMGQTRAAIKAHNITIRRSLRIANQTIQTLVCGSNPALSPYGGGGEAAPCAPAALLNQIG